MDSLDTLSAQEPKHSACFNEIVKTFKEEKVACFVFETIPTELFPCMFRTKQEDYDNIFSIIASFDLNETNGENLKNAFGELTEKFYTVDEMKHKVIARMKWVKHRSWRQPKKIYRVILGTSNPELRELIQIIFCNESDFSCFVDNYKELEYLCSK
ncbi:hypothetical protein IT400_03045 [Candidatus Nomurabacteria bacterium]|nr:hypothetical protein [Candidatus Nomurabacteria bacterium]